MNRQNIRKEFPITKAKYPVLTSGGVKQTSFAYLDNAASTPMPRFLQKKYCNIFNNYYSNVHRGGHYFSKISTEKYEEARGIAMNFIGGNKKSHEIIFTYNTTDSLNLMARIIKDEDGVVLASEMEHHSNYLAYKKDNVVKLFKVARSGEIDYNDLERKFKKYNVKLVAVSGASNVTGIIPDLKKLSNIAHKNGAKILIDGAQMLAHMPVNLKKHKIDFFVGAGHKMYAPGVAFLYGPKKILDKAYPYRLGGGIVNYVTPDGVNYVKGPERHEGGTPNIAGAIILGEAMKWLKKIGMQNVKDHEKKILKYLVSKLKKIPEITIFGSMDFENHLGLVSFNIKGAHHSLASAILNYEGGVAVRNGCHCAHIYLVKMLGVSQKDVLKFTKILSKKDRGKVTEKENLLIPGTLRASMGIFNNKSDIDKLIKAVKMIANKEWKGKYKYKEGTYEITNLK